MVWVLAAGLALLALGLGLKVALLRHGIKGLRRDLAERRGQDTNTLLSLPCRDRELRRLASALNQELRALRQERLRYQQGDKELKEAVVNISHDLRTPLTAISGYLQLLQGQDLPPDTRRYLEQIGGRTQAMKRLTEELFRYSVVVSEENLARELVDLRRAVEEALLSFYGALEGRGIEPQVRLPETPVIRQLDPAAVNRVLGNILTNALKYSAGDLEVTLEESGRLTFSNSAPGLDPVAAGRLFDRFYTVEAARNSTGLGLSIAKELTQRMGGSIGAELHGGTLTVWLKL
ncbi:MAG TPA: HAMP domain-containing histidine kinase [Candidatus Acutalibacter stercoravium]|nr:HAMP domain-containing histidine kinase [Candidatus Acutalibacter stercoravium]